MNENKFYCNSVFEALAAYAALYHRPVEISRLTAGLPLGAAGSTEVISGDGLVDNFARAASRAGLKSRLVKSTLDEISPLNFPLIAVMKDGGGLVINGPKKNEFYNSAADGGGIKPVRAEDIERSYSGFSFLMAIESKNTADCGERTPVSSAGWLYDTLKISAPIYFDVILASVAINIFVLASPIFTMNVYDRVVPNNALETLWALSAGIIIVFILDSVLKFFRSYFIEIAAKKSDILISSTLFSHTMDMRLEETPKNTGSLANCFREFDSIRNFLSSAVMLFIVDLPFCLLTLLAMWYIGGNIVFVPITIMAALLLYTMAARIPLKKIVADSFQAAARKNTMLLEALSGLRDIKAMNAAGSFQFKWEKHVSECAREGLKSRLLSFSIPTVTGFLMQMNSVLIVIYGVYLIRDLHLTMGGLIAVVILSSRTIAPMGQVIALMSSFEHARMAFDSLKQIMEKSVETPPDARFIEMSDINGDIEFSGVNFFYPGSDRPALKNVSFKISKGERVGLLGRTGSGKSTIQKLIMGLYRCREGFVRIDGIDLSQISTAMLRSKISYVPQDFSLFTGTLRENILLKSPSAADKAIIEAAACGGLEQFIKASPEGYDMKIEERGANLSGGQRQGVAVARAFLTDCPVVLLDEPTSSMDATTETTVMDNIKKITGSKTFILTTHKMNMLEMIDRVIVIESGSIVFDGKRAEFIAKFSKNAAQVS